MMHPERKAKWIAALRGGEYVQTTGALKTEDGFCCLGVACDVYLKETRLGHWNEDPILRGSKFNIENESEGSVLPRAVMEWFGIRAVNPAVYITTTRGDKTIYSIATANDGSEVNMIKKHTFAEIADIIEKQL